MVGVTVGVRGGLVMVVVLVVILVVVVLLTTIGVGMSREERDGMRRVVHRLPSRVDENARRFGAGAGVGVGFTLICMLHMLLLLPIGCCCSMHMVTWFAWFA